MPTQAGQMVQSTAAYSGQNTGGLFTPAEQVTLLSTLRQLTDAGFDIAVNGTNQAVGPLDFSSAATLNACAAVIQVGMTGVICSFTNGRFVIRTNATGPTAAVGYALASSGGFTSVHITLRLTAGSGAVTTTGGAALGVQWIAANGRHIFPRLPVGRQNPRAPDDPVPAPNDPASAQTPMDYWYRVGRWGGAQGAYAYKLRIPNAPGWFVSIADSATEATLPPTTYTVRNPPPGVR